MKTIFKLLCLCLALLLLLTACSAPASGSEKPLIDQGLEVIKLMSEMAGNEAYHKLHSANEEVTNTLKKIPGNYSNPTQVYSLTVPEDLFFEIPAGVSPALKAHLQRLTMVSFPNQINAKSGNITVAAASICMASKTFVNRFAKNSLYLYFFADGVPAAVSFSVGDDDTVLAQGTFLLAENFSVEQLSDYTAHSNITLEKIYG